MSVDRGSEDELISNNGYFRPQPVDVYTVMLAVKRLNNTTSVGSDEILFKYVRDFLYVTA